MIAPAPTVEGDFIDAVLATQFSDGLCAGLGLAQNGDNLLRRELFPFHQDLLVEILAFYLALISGVGPHVEAAHLRLLLDCAEICQTSADFMLRGSELHGQVCGVCADVCDRCAQSCAQFGDDQQMQACAEECRKCAESCRKMAGM